jgi:hypothetical protein
MSMKVTLAVQIGGYARGCHGLPRFELGPY